MDEDRWFARVPGLESQGAAARGDTRDEALRNIQEVAQMVIESLLEDGKPLPPKGLDPVPEGRQDSSPLFQQRDPEILKRNKSRRDV